jgi:molybdate transport system regulatory protein
MPARHRGNQTRRKNSAGLQPGLRLWLERKGGVVLGDFRVDLLRVIGETGSLAEAADRLGLSYRRAWGKLREMERNLGKPLVESEKGGAHGGGSRLTPRAERMIAQYARFQEAMERHLGKEFQKVFDA